MVGDPFLDPPDLAGNCFLMELGAATIRMNILFLLPRYLRISTNGEGKHAQPHHGGLHPNGPPHSEEGGGGGGQDVTSPLSNPGTPPGGRTSFCGAQGAPSPQASTEGGPALCTAHEAPLTGDRGL